VLRFVVVVGVVKDEEKSVILYYMGEGWDWDSNKRVYANEKVMMREDWEVQVSVLGRYNW